MSIQPASIHAYLLADNRGQLLKLGIARAFPTATADTLVYRLQFLGHRVEPYAALGTG